MLIGRVHQNRRGPTPWKSSAGRGVVHQHCSDIGRAPAVPEYLAGHWPAAGEVAHHLRVAVQLEQVVYVTLGELAQRQSLCSRMMCM